MSLRWVLLAITLLSSVAGAQPAGRSPERAFRDAVVSQQLYLRNFSADATVQGVWAEGKLVLAPVQIHELAAFVASAVEVSGGHLRLHGIRRLVQRASGTPVLLAADVQPTLVDIDLRGADLDVVLPQLREQLFFDKPGEAIEGLPTKMRRKLPAPSDLPVTPPLPEIRRCDCSDASGVCANRIPTAETVGWTAPRPLHAVDAETGPFSGSAEISVDVDAKGSVTDVWILRGTHALLQLAYAKAALHARFAPAACHQQPVPGSVNLGIDIQ